MSAPTLLPVADGATTWRAVRDRVRPHRRRLLLLVALLLGGTAATLLVPRLLGRLVDLVAGSGGPAALLPPVALLLVTTTASALLGYAGLRLLVAVVQDVVAGLREDAVATVLHLPADLAEGADSADVISRVTADVEAVTEASSGVLPAVTQATFLIVLSLVGIATIDWRLGLAALAAVPVQVVATRHFLARSAPLYAALRVAEARRGQSVLEAVTGADTVRAHRRQEPTLAEVDARSRAAIALEVQAARLRTTFFSRLNAAEYVGLTAILALSFTLVHDGVISLGGATAAALYFLALFGPIGSFLASLDELQLAGVGLARLVGVTGLDHATDCTTLASADRACTSTLPPSPALERSISLERVSFAYDGTDLQLTDVSLTVPPGTCVALVGESGSGKSTLAQLIVGTVQPTAGHVTTAGSSGPTLRANPQVVLVTQELHVFTGTVADNLRLGAPHATDAQLAKALATVGAGWMLELQDGLATAVGSTGRPLDGAAAQQLALARVLLMDPAIVVLDEATAEGGDPQALDAAIAAVTRGRTAIVVAHQLSHARRADHIVVLDAGRSTEAGPHKVLSFGQGKYARLWRARGADETI